MLIDMPEPVAFDFNDSWQEGLALLDEIMFTSGRTRYPTIDPDGELLIELLREGDIGVCAQKYSLARDTSPEEYHAADRLAEWINKSNTGSLLHALPLFEGHEPLYRCNEYNALYYPALKTYVRFGDLYPTKLLAMLGEEQCERVILFRDCADSSTEDRFFIFALGIPRADFLALMEQVQEKRAQDMAEALQVAAAYTEGIFPEVAL
jgi:hypothetical protein